jgi:hypothetical protein
MFPKSILVTFSKFCPEIVTLVPSGPVLGDIDVMTGVLMFFCFSYVIGL